MSAVPARIVAMQAIPNAMQPIHLTRRIMQPSLPEFAIDRPAL
jgi:hypothetical protein